MDTAGLFYFYSNSANIKATFSHRSLGQKKRALVRRVESKKKIMCYELTSALLTNASSVSMVTHCGTAVTSTRLPRFLDFFFPYFDL